MSKFPKEFFNHYVVVGSHRWNKRCFENALSHNVMGIWHYVDTEEALLTVKQWNPRYIFFLHWSKKVPKELTDHYECVCFHPTDLPYGRGGTPIQNLILRGDKTTVVTAFRMTDEIDAGPVYGKSEPIPLSGTAREIYERCNQEAVKLIRWMIKEFPTPTPQTGEITYFKRRTPEESKITCGTLEQLYDFIRMLDAEEYPKAFLECGPFRIEFNRAEWYEDEVETVAHITLK